LAVDPSVAMEKWLQDSRVRAKRCQVMGMKMQMKMEMEGWMGKEWASGGEPW
jgi:hypothetical protein